MTGAFKNSVRPQAEVAWVRISTRLHRVATDEKVACRVATPESVRHRIGLRLSSRGMHARKLLNERRDWGVAEGTVSSYHLFRSPWSHKVQVVHTNW